MKMSSLSGSRVLDAPPLPGDPNGRFPRTGRQWPVQSPTMTAAPSASPTNESEALDNLVSPVPEIPVEIVSDDEMALLDAALALASSRVSLSSSSSPIVQKNVRSVRSMSILAKRRLSGFSAPDIEDSSYSVAKKNRAPPSLFHRFRKKKGLSVTDITATEWCEKQMEFVLLLRKKRTTKAMRAGSERHEKLEQEVLKKVKVQVKSVEDRWAMRFMNFIIGANQLLFDGLTRELPLIGFVQGAWMVGVIDEVQMPVSEPERIPILVDTKTRVGNTLPAEPQRRNGRLQLMCYKYMWDDAVADNFPAEQFFDFFKLNPHLILSDEIRENAAKSGFPAETLDEIIRYYRNTFKMLPPAHSQLLLRYELQKDHSLLGEDQFEYNLEFVEGQIQTCLEFWLGEREANYAPDEERWKCRFCQFARVCPVNTNSEDEASSS